MKLRIWIILAYKSDILAGYVDTDVKLHKDDSGKTEFTPIEYINEISKIYKKYACDPDLVPFIYLDNTINDGGLI